MPEKIELDDGMAETLRTALDLDQFYPALSAEKAMRLFPSSGHYYYVKGETIVNQGEDSQDIYIIQTGSVEVSQSMGTVAALVAVLGPGEMFGEMALVQKGPRTATVAACDPSRIYRLSIKDVERIMCADDKLKKHLAELAQRRQAGG